ncbi:MAG: DegT/DnrJ/EryC1/StrS aminotransferase family protein [Geobacteraceae bacterium]|nr:DegT/DnrJ/EryC1/StrS aminotransferase family protein [Geobacteraceae bacterium]
MPDFLPFALPDIGEEEITEVVDSIRSGWLTTGPKTKRFEQEFAAFIGNNAVEAVAVNSATAGLHLALEAIGIGPGDEVITTTHTFTATAEVVRYLGADPVFVDIDAATFNLDVDQIERAITPQTKAIIPVHFAGLSCDMASILSIAGKHGLRVVEDAAHALPATCGGKMIGTLASDAAVFSFYATKTITTGEGGMIVTANPEIAARCRTMRLHGISRDAFDRYTSTKPGWFYEVVAPGFKYNMTDIAAALGIQQLKKAQLFQARRAEMATCYDEALRGLPVTLPPHAPAGDSHAWHLYVLRLKPEAPVTRNRFIELMSEKGVGTSVHFIPLHLHPFWRERYHLMPEQFPHSQLLFEQSVSLPLYTKMTESDQKRVVTTIREILV